MGGLSDMDRPQASFAACPILATGGFLRASISPLWLPDAGVEVPDVRRTRAQSTWPEQTHVVLLEAEGVEQLQRPTKFPFRSGAYITGGRV
jgi:hypothetical protein